MWLTEEQTHSILEKLQGNRTVRRNLPGHGRLFIDRQLPFLCVYRNTDNIRDTGMDRMTAGEAAYICASARKEYRPGISALVRDIAEIGRERFGAFLILEIWPGEVPRNKPNLPPQPLFRVFNTRPVELPETSAYLKKKLEGIRTSKLDADVKSLLTPRPSPPGMVPCLPAAEMRRKGIKWLGLEISPIYINPATNELYPLLFRAVRRQVPRAMGQAFFIFTQNHTTHRPPHFHTLGRRAVVKAVWEVDRMLSEIGNSFDLLRLVTPVNAETAWTAFQRNHFQKPPRFLYLPRPVDPGAMKRRLFSVPIEKIEDPTLMRLFLDKQLELDRELSLMADLNREAFRFGSLQLHGTVKSGLLVQAEQLLTEARNHRESASGKGEMTAKQFLAQAESAISLYRQRHIGFKGSARISQEMYSGMLVSKGELLIGGKSRFPRRRCDALLQHEVGTHVLTWSNGKAQPLQLLAAGLPRYDEFQEGLAVLAEHLCGGLDPQRLHVLAARVVAVKAMIGNADFMDVFRLLTGEYGFTPRSAYVITMRVFRGGGLAKDAVYLRGLSSVLKYLSNGGSFENCFAGKMGGEYMPVYEELLLRRILKPPAVLPAYLERPEVKERLSRVVAGITISDLIDKRK